VPQGQDGSQLTPASFSPNTRNLSSPLSGADLLPNQQRWSVYTTGKKFVAQNTQLFADALFSQRDVSSTANSFRVNLPVPESNAFYVNPSGTRLPVSVAYDFGKDLGNIVTETDVRTLELVAGANVQLAEKWRLTATGDFASERLQSKIANTVDFDALLTALADSNRATAFNPFGDGSHTNPATVERLRGRSTAAARSHLWTGNITASREFAGWQGGEGKFVFGGDYRNQTFTSDLSAGSAFSAGHDLHRRVRAAFAAVSVPILSARADQPGRNRLEVSLAGRYEDYTDFGHVTTPRFGMTFTPTHALTLRSTWSRSFRPPNLLDLDETQNFLQLFPVADSAAPGGQSLVIARSGNNAQLREERARSWTFGLDWDIAAVRGLSTALTYFDTTFTDRVNNPQASAALLTDPALTGLVTRDPTTQARQAFCDSARLVNGSTSTCMTAAIAALADLRVRNSALMETNGIDLLGQYEHQFGRGRLTLRLDGTYILSFSDTPTRNLPLTEKVSTQNNPIDLRLRGAVSWQAGPVRTSALVNYFDGYRDVLSVPQRRVASWTTVDMNLAWSTSAKGESAFSGMTFALDAENVFDEPPPFLNNPVGMGYDQENGDLMGRILSVSVRKNW
jgi:outer membrane receptor protein involved in Fe transport